ncbi:lysine-2,3-aminomutase-like protein [Szabonella alba]|uniref:Lysine-2,3-aminomutase-like protein n=1 Tax=Szabonella alba TaxID=2804194 RepID=A0A8K0Y1N4_9RHOB|nr:lysine-2,3-aminomutase-like protein [Szabonella alba]MBL4918047.1 lysine-2,3-aminomutase-like protein [Szabonella alba]
MKDLIKDSAPTEAPQGQAAEPSGGQARALTTPAQFVAAGLADPVDAAALGQVAAEFKLRMSPEMARAVAAPGDGVARQFVPEVAELTIRPEELADPIGDDAHAPVPGLTHRYPDRVILHATKTCEVYCRFCFRREVVGEEGALPEAEMAAALDYVAATPAVREVILTGGDPLTLSPRRLASVMARLGAIPHLDVIRFHTRVPVVAPEKVTPDLLAAMESDKAVWLVVHTNHAQELTEAAQAALRRLVAAGIPLLSQTVLLRGINDDPDTLEALFRALIRAKVKPYYLHHCDLAKGTGHFRTTIARGQAIMTALRARLSGMALPAYVLDIPGGYGKVPIGPDYLLRAADGLWQVRDPKGDLHRYADPSAPLG